jgi:hypothetical protein
MMDVVDVVDGYFFVDKAIEVDHLSVRALNTVHKQGEFGVFRRFEVVLNPNGWHQGIGLEYRPSAEDEFNAHDAEGGVGLHQPHGEIAGHFLGEFADAVESGIQNIAHVCESAVVGMIEVVVAHHVEVFAVFDQADVAEKRPKRMDVLEVVEVENFFHDGCVFVLYNKLNVYFLNRQN